ncbi:MAG: hypothetical protein IJB32_01185 [Clostridia bacterium]|nr:hypothetical protein [Clostridia bacterium]
MKNFKKNYEQPIVSVISALSDDVLVASGNLGVGDYNINWLKQEGAND